MTVTAVEPVVETRSAQVADINFPKRLITVLAMPYEQATDVVYRGRLVKEIVSRGAFDGIERRSKAIKVNRDHSWDKVVGKIVGLHPSRTEGLVSEIKISKTPLGDDSLELASDGVLDASAGFALLRRDDGRVYDNAEVWERNRTVRRLNRLWLDHLALVPDPAYEGATVLDVRRGPGRAESKLHSVETVGATPNLDRMAFEALRAKFDALDARWPH